MTTTPDTTAYRLPDTLQEVYDIVAQHLLTQGAVALQTLPHGGVACAYRGDNGLKCAIGALIPDHLYCPELEGKGPVAALADIGLLNVNDLSNPSTLALTQLLILLQRAHDDAQGLYPHEVVPFWKRRLAEIAERFELRPFTRAMQETSDASAPCA